MVCSMVLNAFCYSYYPDIAYKFIRYYPWFAVGMALKNTTGDTLYIDKKKIIFASTCLFAIILRVFFVDISFMHPYVRATYMQLEWLLCALSGMIFFATVVEKLNSKGKSGLLVYIGNESYVIYLLHNPWIIIPVAIISPLFVRNTVVNIGINFISGLVLPILLVVFSRTVWERVKCNENQN